MILRLIKYFIKKIESAKRDLYSKEINITINIKSIVKYELLTKKSFNDIDFESEDIFKLLYCVVMENNKERFTFEEFNDIIKSEKITKEITDKFKKEIKILGQFANKSEKIVELDEDDEKKESFFIKDLVATLVVKANIDINYIMNNMQINEFESYIKAYSNRTKEKLENDRLWTYLTILPHLSDNKLTPQKLYHFPWDIEKEVEIKPQMTVDDYDDIMKRGVEIINNIK